MKKINMSKSLRIFNAGEGRRFQSPHSTGSTSHLSHCSCPQVWHDGQRPTPQGPGSLLGSLCPLHTQQYHNRSTVPDMVLSVLPLQSSMTARSGRESSAIGPCFCSNTGSEEPFFL